MRLLPRTPLYSDGPNIQTLPVLIERDVSVVPTPNAKIHTGVLGQDGHPRTTDVDMSPTPYTKLGKR